MGSGAWRTHCVVFFDESWLDDIGWVGGPDGPTPVGWVWELKNCMNVSPRTTFSEASAPSLIFSAVTTTVPSCSKRSSLLPLPFLSRTTSPSSSKVSSWPALDRSAQSVDVGPLPSPCGVSAPVSLPSLPPPPLLLGAPEKVPLQIG